MQEEIYNQMYEVEWRHWWFSAKRRIIRHLLGRHLPQTQGKRRLADIGCGCGRNIEELGAQYETVGVDPSQTAIDFCRQRGVHAQIGALPDDLPLEPGAYDAVILSDILEHVEDDRAAAQAAAELLCPGGIMVVTVPALGRLWSHWDVIHGHKRRYTRKGLAQTLYATGLDTVLLSYYNTFLFPIAAAVRLTQKLLKRRGIGELKIPPPPFNGLLRFVLASERHLIGRAPMPIGLSLVAVMRRAGA